MYGNVCLKVRARGPLRLERHTWLSPARIYFWHAADIAAFSEHVVPEADRYHRRDGNIHSMLERNLRATGLQFGRSGKAVELVWVK
jgi:hypothetical protein